ASIDSTLLLLATNLFKELLDTCGFLLRLVVVEAQLGREPQAHPARHLAAEHAARAGEAGERLLPLRLARLEEADVDARAPQIVGHLDPRHDDPGEPRIARLVRHDRP